MGEVPRAVHTENKPDKVRPHYQQYVEETANGPKLHAENNELKSGITRSPTLADSKGSNEGGAHYRWRKRLLCHDLGKDE